MVSIIVTTYNYAHFLPETIGSVKDQSYPDWECIVVDSGSTDNTSSVMNEIISGDTRIKYIRQANLGVSAARNTGIRSSSGDFIQFLDGDDLLQRNKIAAQVRCFEKLAEADIVYSDVRFFDDTKKDELRHSLTGKKESNWLPKLSGRKDTVLRFLKSFNFLVTHSPLVRRNVIDKAGLFDETMHGMEDWDYWLRCAFNNSYFHYCEADESMVFVRVHGSSLSKKKESMMEGNFTLLENAVKRSNTGVYYKLFFAAKFTELFWDSVFSGRKIPVKPVLLLVVSVLFFPFWCIIKFARMIKLI